MTPGSIVDPAGDPVGRRVFRFVAVGDDAELETGDAGSTGRRERQRRSLPGRLHEAALRAVLRNLRGWAVVILVSAAAATALLAPGAHSLAWSVALAAIGAAAWFVPRRYVRAPLPPARQRKIYLAVAALVGWVAMAMAALPWVALADQNDAGRLPASTVAVAASVVTLVGAASLAPLRWLNLALLVVPVSTGLAALAAEGWVLHATVLAPHAILLIGLLALAAQRTSAWQQNTRSLLEMGDRIRQLESERDAAARADVEKSRFLAIASHDLRQPVHALALFTATLHRRTQHSDDEPLVRNMVRAIDGLERSFNSLLDISRLDAGTLAPSLQTFTLRDLFRRLHMHYGGQAELAGLALRFSPGGRSVHSDPQMLERVLGNLIQNAIKYTEHGGIVVVARRAAGAVHVEVWDTGAGIAPEELPRIFDEYYQIGRAERDRSRGLGMGLAIVRRLVRVLGHRLTVASCVGRGTMFRIAIATSALGVIQDAVAPADTVPMAVTGPRMVLVVDDEEPIREGLRLLLEEWGYQAMTAASAAQAEQVTEALEGRIDLILSDLHLGDGPDGLQAIEAVQRLCMDEVAAILITGDTAPSELKRITASGHMVLFKPVQPRRLYEALRDELG